MLGSSPFTTALALAPFPPVTRLCGDFEQVDLEDGIMLFRRLGVDVQASSAEDFKLAYHRLARRYHPDLNRNGHELMANINAARAAILKAWHS
jgi:hypothetical protein